jgi:F0F1-type ATP synthase membrane subunit c/vacuolar-type H+-ATPase subunit K
MYYGLGQLGIALAMGIAAVGSAIGIGIAGQASIGAWKKCYMSNKAAPFILTVFAGAPLTQTIYGFLLMQQMKSSDADPMFLLGLVGSFLAYSYYMNGFRTCQAGFISQQFTLLHSTQEFQKELR